MSRIWSSYTDLAGNVTEKSVTVDKIDKVAPSVPVVTADVTEITAGNVTLTVETDQDTAALEYSYNSRTWYTCSGELVMSSNSSVYFRCTDLAGNQSVVRYVVDNIDKSAPGVPEDISITVNKNSVSADWSDVSDKGKAGVAGYLFRYGSSDHLTGTGISVTASAFEINDLAAGTWYYQVAAVDSVGNISNWSQISSFVILPAAPEDLVGSANGVSASVELVFKISSVMEPKELITGSEIVTSCGLALGPVPSCASFNNLGEDVKGM